MSAEEASGRLSEWESMSRSDFAHEEADRGGHRIW